MILDMLTFSVMLVVAVLFFVVIRLAWLSQERQVIKDK